MTDLPLDQMEQALERGEHLNVGTISALIAAARERDALERENARLRAVVRGMLVERAHRKTSFPKITWPKARPAKNSRSKTMDEAMTDKLIELARIMERIAACDWCHGTGSITRVIEGMAEADECPECHGACSTTLSRKDMQALRTLAGEKP